MTYDLPLSTERSSILGTESFRDHLSKSIENSQNHIFILSGYVKSNGMEWLKKKLNGRNTPCTIIAQWTEQNLLEGGCDLQSYEIAKENNWNFKILNNLHAKVALIDKNILYIGSGNLTGRGMALIPASNRELGVAVKPTIQDTTIINKLVNEAILVDDHLHSQFSEWLSQQEKIAKPKYNKFPDEIKNILKNNYEKIWASNFPWCSFEELQINNDQSDDLLNRQKHDFELFGVENFDYKLIKENTKDLHIYHWLMEHLKKKEGNFLYFGELTKLIHDSLYDDPRPYRREIKDLQQNIYSFIENLSLNEFEITRPNHSQKITLV